MLEPAVRYKQQVGSLGGSSKIKTNYFLSLIFSNFIFLFNLEPSGAPSSFFLVQDRWVLTGAQIW
jgi:hypothetical protein